MRRVRYQVACSLDGYIAGPKGEYDWIVMDPDIDFNALTVELAIVPVLLGAGLPFLPAPAVRRSLRYTGQKVYGKSGIVLLTYDVIAATPAKRRKRKDPA